MYSSADTHLLLCIIKDFNKVEAILTGFLDLGITGATVIDSRGMGEIISEDIPVFAGLRSFFPRGNLHTYIILSVVKHIQIADAFSLIREICGDLCEPGTGIVFTLPVTKVYGLAQGL
ncbi:hypothetical protein JXA40_01740 [bacterium]|nr:hypothetical protein [candidate division CSSED10-310 bacterium]